MESESVDAKTNGIKNQQPNLELLFAKVLQLSWEETPPVSASLFSPFLSDAQSDVNSCYNHLASSTSVMGLTYDIRNAVQQAVLLVLSEILKIRTSEPASAPANSESRVSSVPQVDQDELTPGRSKYIRGWRREVIALVCLQSISKHNPEVLLPSNCSCPRIFSFQCHSCVHLGGNGSPALRERPGIAVHNPVSTIARASRFEYHAGMFRDTQVASRTSGKESGEYAGRNTGMCSTCFYRLIEFIKKHVNSTRSSVSKVAVRATASLVKGLTVAHVRPSDPFCSSVDVGMGQANQCTTCCWQPKIQSERSKRHRYLSPTMQQVKQNTITKDVDRNFCVLDCIFDNLLQVLLLRAGAETKFVAVEAQTALAEVATTVATFPSKLSGLVHLLTPHARNIRSSPSAARMLHDFVEYYLIRTCRTSCINVGPVVESPRDESRELHLQLGRPTSSDKTSVGSTTKSVGESKEIFDTIVKIFPGCFPLLVTLAQSQTPISRRVAKASIKRLFLTLCEFGGRLGKWDTSSDLKEYILDLLLARYKENNQQHCSDSEAKRFEEALRTGWKMAFERHTELRQHLRRRSSLEESGRRKKASFKAQDGRGSTLIRIRSTKSDIARIAAHETSRDSRRFTNETACEDTNEHAS